MDAQGKRTLKIGITVGLSLGAIVGLVGCGEEQDSVEGHHEFGLSSSNGLGAGNGLSMNGLSVANGLSASNGLSAANGLSSANGLAIANGLSSANGLSASNGFMTNDAGRKTVAYLAKCALASGDSLVKQDQYGANYTFPGAIGLCPAWKNGGIATDRGCMNRISACLMAHVNTAGVHIPIWLDSEYSAIGWGLDLTNYPFQEGTFFGNVMLTGDLTGVGMAGVTAPAAYFCDGNGFLNGNTGVVAGRLGKGQNNAPYMNPFGDGTLCNNKGAGQYTYGTGGQPAPDGFKQMCTSNYCFQNGDPITVWRNNTYTPTFDGVYNYRMSPLSSPGSSIDISNGSTTNGTVVQQYSTWNGDPQKFNILPNSSGYWTFTMKTNNAKCVGPVANGTVNGTLLEVQDCNGSSNQAWTVTADTATGGFTYKNVASGRCLDVVGGNTADGTRMEIWSCNGGSNQKFKILSGY